MMDPRISRRISQTTIIGLGIGIAVWLVTVIGESGLYGLMIAILALAPIAWIVFAGPRWWMLMPLSVIFGGFFVLDFKIFTHEIALPLCLLALLPMLATRRLTRIRRAPLPPATWLLLLLFAGKAVASLYISQSEGSGGAGNIARIYFHGLWAIVFMTAFHLFGETRHLKTLLVLAYAIALSRVMVGFLVFILQRYIYIPYLNYVLGGTAQGLADFRFIGLQLAILSGVCFLWASGRWTRLFHAVITLASGVLVVMSGGRVSVGMLCGLPLIWALVRGQFRWISAFGTMLLITVVFLNQRPDLVYHLPEEAQRALSILIRESSTRWTDQHENVRASNEWHRRLIELGFARWTESPLTVVFGNRVEAYSKGYESYSATMEVRAQIAARMGLYESGLWTVLGILGAVGLLMYLRLLYFCLKGPFLELRHHGVRDLSHVFYLWAVLSVGLWAAFSWIAGGYPSYELMLAGFAKAAFEDSREQAAGSMPATDERG